MTKTLALSIILHLVILGPHWLQQDTISLQSPSTKAIAVKITSAKKPTRPLPKKVEKKVKKQNSVTDEIIKENKETETEVSQTYVTDAATHFAPAPVYPRQARLRGIEGLVKVRLGVNGKGVPVLIDLIESSGHEMLDQAAIYALKKWRFMINGNESEEITFWTEKVIEFQIK